MKSIFCLLLFTISLSTFSQIKFKNGYFINNSGQKIDCLIKDLDWKNNPTQFEYKISSDAEINIGKIQNIKEFNVIDIVKYVRADIDIDISQENYSDISLQREPVFEKKLIFLKALVEGSNNLYVYNSEEYPLRFFFNNQTLPLQQLIYKKYNKSDNDKSIISTNEDYKRQLFANTNCENSQQSSIETLSYKKSEMIKYFMKVNNCLGDSVTKQKYVDKETTINFKPILSINSASLVLNYASGTFEGKNNIGNKINYGFGFEVEFVFPYDNNNWSVSIEPSYITTYNSEIYFNKPNLIYPDYTIKATYNYLQAPILGKRSFYLTKNSKLFLNIGLNMSLVSNTSKIIIERDPGVQLEDLNLGGISINYLMGIGIQYKKFNLEFRYYTNNNFNSKNNSTDTYTYKNSSLNLKYLLF